MRASLPLSASRAVRPDPLRLSVGSRQQPEGGVLLLVYEMRLAHRRTLYFVLRVDIFCCVFNLFNRTHAVALQVREPDQESRGEGGNPKVQRTKYIQCLCILISPLSSRVLPSERSVPSPSLTSKVTTSGCDIIVIACLLLFLIATSRFRQSFFRSEP